MDTDARRVNKTMFHLAVFLWCSLFPAIGSLSLKPPAEEILNKHLCPDPVISASASEAELSKSLPVRLQPRTGTHTYFSKSIRPCTFMELPQSDNNSTQIRIQSINLNMSPWNFSTATGECSKFIMFRRWSEYGNGYPVMCGRESFDKFLGPYGYPMILYYHLRDEGISFPLFHPNYEPLGSSSIGNHRRDQQKSIYELKYMLIYYSIRSPDGKLVCRLQQYSINPLQGVCPISTSTTTSTSSICGEYQCSELDALYQKKMGGGADGADFQQQRFILVKSNNQEKYRVRNFLRQKFVPILFLVILICAYKTYMKAGLRLHEQMPMPVSETRLRRYSHRHSHHHLGRDPFRDIYFDHGSDDNNAPAGLHIPFEPASPAGGGGGGVRAPGDLPSHDGSSSHGKFLAHSTDPPPPYDTLFPPSYNELFYSTPNNHSESSLTPTATTAALDAKNPKV